MKKQVTAVVEEVKNVLGETYDLSVPSVNSLDKASITAIQGVIFDGLAAGEIEYKGDVTNVKTLKTYANGLVTNHLRKCKQLNGNVKYEASGNGPKRDERLRELNKVLVSGDFLEGTAEFVAIQEAIAFRKTELVQAKVAAKSQVKASEIDMSVLPPGLQEVVSNASASVED